MSIIPEFEEVLPVFAVGEKKELKKWKSTLRINLTSDISIVDDRKGMTERDRESRCIKWDSDCEESYAAGGS
jgi:hypothetical protein